MKKQNTMMGHINVVGKDIQTLEDAANAETKSNDEYLIQNWQTFWNCGSFSILI